MRFIGCKNNLLANIEELVNNKCKNSKSLCDLFSGTGTVGSYFKNKYKIISNDILYFSYVLQKGYIETNEKIEFKKLKEFLKCDDVYEYLNNLNYKEFDGNKCIADRYSPIGNRMYLREENAIKIDYMRTLIEEWCSNNIISDTEYYYLIACIIQEVPSVSNISGTYGAFLKEWDKRCFKDFKIYPLEININKHNNICYNKNGLELLEEISGDILYLDPPYNSRQYLPNYHVLETVAKYDFPEVSGITGVRKYSSEKSNWCLKTKVEEEFTNIMKKAQFKHIILSYNSEGLLSKEKIEEIMKTYGDPKSFALVEIPYRRFRSRSANAKHGVDEYLFYISKDIDVDTEVLKEDTSFTQLDLFEEKKEYVKSPLNYIGGKYKLLNHIFKLVPENVNTFYDIFGGGFNVGINAEAKRIIYNDLNIYVKDMFVYFKSKEFNEISKGIDELIEKYQLSKTNNEGYLALREDYNKNPSSLKLFVLTCFSFNHQIRFNNKHEFNTPFGKDRSSYNESIKNNLKNFCYKLQNNNIEFYSKNFVEFKNEIYNTNDVVYCDPPYLITNGSYNDGNRGFKDWGTKEEQELLDYLDYLNEKNIKFILSNVLEHKEEKNELLIEWSKKYNIVYLDKNYKNCNYHFKFKDSVTVEVLITNIEINKDE